MNLIQHPRLGEQFFDQEDGPYLKGWYPGIGEDYILQNMSPTLREFLCDAVEEHPPFVDEYLLPTLGELNAEQRIAEDLSTALSALEFEEEGLGSYEEFLEDPLFLGDFNGLGGVLSKVKKAVKKVAKKVIAPVKKVIEKITPKPILALQKKIAHGITKVNKVVARTQEKVEHVAGKVGKKYGNTIIGVVGAVLAPFTGGASLAAAALLTAANTTYQKKRAADQAKKAASKDADQLKAEAAAADAQLMAQVDAFYAQNQEWFIQRGITPDQWSHMTLQQKIDAINSGASGPGGGTGTVTPPDYSTPTTGPTPPNYGTGPGPAPGGGSGGPDASGGGGGDWSLPSGGGGGGGGGGSSAGGSAAAKPKPGQPAVSEQGMFGGSAFILPALAFGAAIAIFGGGKKTGRRSTRARRNPGRRHRGRRW